MSEEAETTYDGSETTGFQPPSQDHIEEVIDLRRILDLRKPGVYPFRVEGDAMRERGIHEGDILILNTAGRRSHGKVAVTILHGQFRLATLEHVRGAWFLRPSGTKEAVPVADDADVWAIVAGLVRESV